MYMGYDRCSFGKVEEFLFVTSHLGDRADPHRRSIAPTVVWPHVGTHPFAKHAPIPTVWVFADISAQIVSEVTIFHETVGDSYRA